VQAEGQQEQGVRAEEQHSQGASPANVGRQSEDCKDFPRCDGCSFDAIFEWDLAGSAEIRCGAANEETLNAARYVDTRVLQVASIKLGQGTGARIPTRFSELRTFLCNAYRPKNVVLRIERLKKLKWTQGEDEDIFASLAEHGTRFQLLKEALGVLEKAAAGIFANSLKGPIGKHIREYKSAQRVKDVQALFEYAIQVVDDAQTAKGFGMVFADSRSAVRESSSAGKAPRSGFAETRAATARGAMTPTAPTSRAAPPSLPHAAVATGTETVAMSRPTWSAGEPRSTEAGRQGGYAEKR